MFHRIGFGAVAMLIALAFAPSSASAVPLPPSELATTEAATQSPLILAHSRRRARRLLRDYGFYRIRFRRKRYDYDDRPIYIFTACRRHKRFRLAVNWYGELVRKRRAGFCRRKHWRRYYY